MGDIYHIDITFILPYPASGMCRIVSRAKIFLGVCINAEILLTFSCKNGIINSIVYNAVLFLLI